MDNTSHRTVARRNAANRAATLAPFEAMTDAELIRAHHVGDNRAAAYTVISDRVNARRIPIDYTGHDDAIEALVAAFRAATA